MENIRNKANNIYPKDYLYHLTMLGFYSFTKSNDKNIYIEPKPDEVYSLFNGNTSSIKKEISFKKKKKSLMMS